MDFSNNKIYITVKDHSVSGEQFQLLADENLGLLKTHPQPLPENLGRYYESEDYISHTDGKRSFFEKIYHFVKQKALQDKIGIVESFQNVKGSLLDIGAGTGDFLVTAKNRNWNVKGIEPSEKARTTAQNKGIDFFSEITGVQNASFDVVTMWHVLEHVPDIEKHIKELKRILKPGGTIFIAVPNYKSFDAKHYGQFWAAYDVPRHLWHFSKMAVQKLFAAERMEVIEIIPMKFDSFYVSLLSEKYKTGKMNFVTGFFNGLRSNLKAAKNMEYSSHIYVIKQDKI